MPEQLVPLFTPLTKLLNVKSPIVVPPMAGASGGSLAANVTLAGGYGLMAPGYGDVSAFKRELDLARSILGSSSNSPLNIGVGFLGWTLDKGGNAVDALRIALEQRVHSIWLSFGDNLGKWVQYIREYDANREMSHRTLIWILINSAAEAKQAVEEYHPDVLVVQGAEAGGHGHGKALPLISLLPLVIQSVPNSPPLVAAGGISTGGQVAALLTLGASGCAIGTRYLATPEATYTDKQKGAVVDATVSVRTRVFDELRGTVGWPSGIDGRAIPNKSLEDAASGLDITTRKKLFDDAVKADDVSRRIVWSGSSVALVNKITPAAELTVEIHRDAVTHLQQGFSILSEKQA